MRFSGFIILGLLATLSSEPARAAEVLYDVRANGFRFGEFRVNIERDAEGYFVTASADAQGLLGLLIRSKYDGTASGSIGPDGDLIPGKFSATSTRIFKRRSTQITFTDGKPTEVILSPLKDLTEYSDPTRISTGRLDSLSYLALMFVAPAQDCPATTDLYDGRRLTRVDFDPPAFEGGLTVCTGTYAIEAGPDHSLQADQRQFLLRLEFQASGGSPDQMDIVSGKNEVVFRKAQD